MPSGEERRLKLVRAVPPAEPTAPEPTAPEPTGSGPTSADRRRVEGRPAAARVRQQARRTVTRRMPRDRDPVRAILERLDEEPVDSDASPGITPPPPPADRQPDDDPTATDPPKPDDDPTATDPPKPDDAPPNGPTADGAEITGDPQANQDRESTSAPKQSDAPKPADDPTVADDRAADGDPAVDDDPVGVAGRDLAGGPVPARRRGTTIVLAAALAAAVALAGILGYQWYQDRSVEQARTHALAAARQTTVNFVSVSASSVDGDLQRITAGATGEFKEEFLRGQAQVRAAVIENKVESTGTVLRAGLVSGGLRDAVALVAVDATVRNVHTPDGRAAHYRIQVDLTRDRDSGAWLVSRLQFVG